MHQNAKSIDRALIARQGHHGQRQETDGQGEDEEPERMTDGHGNGLR
jgi:hypothetical protein